MNKYEEIDGILENFAKVYNLPIYTLYKEDQVRSFNIGDAKGKEYQLWIDPPDKKGKINIHTWDYKKKRKDFTAEQSNLFENLQAAHEVISEWING